MPNIHVGNTDLDFYTSLKWKMIHFCKRCGHGQINHSCKGALIVKLFRLLMVKSMATNSGLQFKSAFWSRWTCLAVPVVSAQVRPDQWPYLLVGMIGLAQEGKAFVCGTLILF